MNNNIYIFNLRNCETRHWPRFQIHSFVFLAIVVVLLVNLLIAMMGDTYTKIAEIKNEWMRQVRDIA